MRLSVRQGKRPNQREELMIGQLREGFLGQSAGIQTGKIGPDSAGFKRRD